MALNKEKAVSELGISEQMYDELVKDFLGQADEVIKKLDQAIGDDNFEEIAKSAHFLKGSAGNLRIEEIQNIAKEIELVGKETKDKKLIVEKARHLKTAFEELRGLI